MKTIYTSIFHKFIWLAAFAMLAMPSFSQEDVAEEIELKKTRSDFIYNRLANGNRHLSAKIFTKEGRNFYYLSNNEVKFILRGDTAEIELGTVLTNDQGIADLFIEKDYSLDTNAYGSYTFAFTFDGNDTCKSVDEELDIRDLNIAYEFTDDGEGYRTVAITLTNDIGAFAAEQEVYVYVKRLYSLLPIGDDWSDDDGFVEIEFPNDLPGDSLGILDVVIKVQESDDFGTVTVSEKIPWGIAVDYSEPEAVRALWAQNTPLWMVIAISIVLIGAWSQFTVAIYHLFKMRKSA